MKKDAGFEEIARKSAEESVVAELWALIRHRKKYWMAPIIIVLMLLGVMILLSSTAAAPFIYTLF